MTERWFTHASPTLFNAGTCRPQLSSCFLICMKDDSIEVRGQKGVGLQYCSDELVLTIKLEPCRLFYKM